MRIKAALIAHLYAKALRRRITTTSGGDPAAFDGTTTTGPAASTTTGEMHTMFAVDTNKICELVAYLDQVIEATLVLIVTLIALYSLLGWSALVGVCILIGALSLVLISCLRWRSAEKN